MATGRLPDLLTDDGRAAVTTAARYAGSWLAFRQRHLRVPGVQAAVSLGGDLLLDVAAGAADLATGQPLTTRHLFRVASHSKTFTATAVLRLHEQGRLRLDDTAGAWVPALAGSRVEGVTVRALLNHVAGVVRDGEDGDHWTGLRPFPDEDALLQVLRDDSAVVLGPHERFKYSNVGYALLGLVVAAAGGGTWAEVVQREVLDVLGLRDTAPGWVPERAGDHATGHTALAYADVRAAVPHLDARAMDAATGVSSTAADLCRYATGHGLGDERLLTDATKRLAQHAGWPVGGRPGGGEPDGSYGLGFAVTEVGDRSLVGHGGAFPGFITATLLDPGAALAVSVLTNAIDGPAHALARGVVALVDLAAGGEPDPALAAGADRLDRWTGRFATVWGVMDLVRLGDRLVALDPGADDPVAGFVELRLEEEREDGAVLRVVDAPGYASYGEAYRVALAPDGSVASVRAGSGTTMWPYDAWVAREGWSSP